MFSGMIEVSVDILQNVVGRRDQILRYRVLSQVGGN